MTLTKDDTMETQKIGIVGARGYVGREILELLANHAGFEIAFASSRRLAGKAVSDQVENYDGELQYEELSPGDVRAAEPDAVVLALPNGLSAPFVDLFDRKSPQTVLVDVSSDHRFDAGWQYAQPERFRDEISTATRIANPGCYATGAQLALAPFVDHLSGTPTVFGVSGYSGAGTKPSPKNDTERLRDNLMPYKLTGHTHEREVGEHIDHPIHFTPHVAPFFRGITLTISMEFEHAKHEDELWARMKNTYGDEPLIELQDEAPLVRDNAHEHHVAIGGLDVSGDGEHAVVVATLDNLLKGAATQAVQNLNLACGYDELTGIDI